MFILSNKGMHMAQDVFLKEVAENNIWIEQRSGKLQWNMLPLSTMQQQIKKIINADKRGLQIKELA